MRAGALSSHLFNHTALDWDLDMIKNPERLSWHLPSSTVMTKPTPRWPCVHPDEGQNRVLTPREVARLQSFPDSFKFVGSTLQVFKQVGNAVPCLMAKAIGLAFMRQPHEKFHNDHDAAMSPSSTSHFQIPTLENFFT